MSNREPEAGGPSPALSPAGFDVRDPLPRAIRDPSFPASVRGYERRAVDSYVERVNRLIAELQVSGSPRAAVRHALDRVGEQTSSILQRARETAEEITTSAREEAEETTARARAEGEEILTTARREAEDARSRAGADADATLAEANAQADEVLTSARGESESTVARARLDADRRIRSAEDEIAALRERAEAERRELQADMAAISEERTLLIDELRRIRDRLGEIVADSEQDAPDDAAAEGAPVAAIAGGAEDGEVAED
jgi:cell division septum initiation protein DivIVA